MLDLLIASLILVTGITLVVGSKKGYKTFNDKISSVAQKYPNNHDPKSFNEVRDIWIITGWIMIVVSILAAIVLVISKGETIRIGF